MLIASMKMWVGREWWSIFGYEIASFDIIITANLLICIIFYLASRLQLHNKPTASLQRSKTLTTILNCPGYNMKQFDGEASVRLELWVTRSTPLLPSLPGLLCPRVVAPDRVRSIDQIEQNSVLMLKWIVWNWQWDRVLMLNWTVWNRTVFQFNCVYMNDLCLIELLVIHNNTWNHWTLLTELNSLK